MVVLADNVLINHHSLRENQTFETEIHRV